MRSVLSVVLTNGLRPLAALGSSVFYLLSLQPNLRQLNKRSEAIAISVALAGSGTAAREGEAPAEDPPWRAELAPAVLPKFAFQTV